MAGLTFSPASALSLPELVDVFNAAFAGYFVPMRHTEESLGAMLRVNDVRLDASPIARTPAGELAGVCLLAARGERGWIGGMAVTPAFRGAGNGSALLGEVIGRARTLGLRTLQLEVLDENAPARRLYERHGFAETRGLAVYSGVPAALPAVPAAGTSAVHAIPVAHALVSYDATHQVAAPWQREPASLAHMAATLEARALLDGPEVAAYLLAMRTGPGYSVIDFGSRAATEAERERHGITLLAHLLHGAPDAPLRAINVPPGDTLGPALNAIGCPVATRQREMLLRLD